MAESQLRVVESNVSADVEYYNSQVGRFDWETRHGQEGIFWEVKVGDTMLQTDDPRVLEVESDGGLDGIALFVTSWQIVLGRWPGPVSDPESLEVNQYLHVRWPNEGDPEATHQALLFNTGLCFRSYEEINAQE